MFPRTCHQMLAKDATKTLPQKICQHLMAGPGEHPLLYLQEASKGS